MEIDATKLSQMEKQSLSALAEKSGDDGVRAAVDAYLERGDEPAEPNGAAKSDQAREQAFREAAGGWADMDVDTWLKAIYDQRLRSSRPAPEL